MPISVIIPTLNEAETITSCVRSVRRQQPTEIVVADGGSEDSTVALASAADIVLGAPRGRAAQMNAGAARCGGDLLLFLHADCQLAPGAIEEAQRLLGNRHVAAVCFAMKVLAAGSAFRCIEACASARVRLTGFIYGDQGLFVRRGDFERLGGFPPVRLMEDVLLSACLRRLGRMVVARSPISVSARRWRRGGLVQQTLRNWTLTGLAAAGIHPDKLANWYPPVR